MGFSPERQATGGLSTWGASSATPGKSKARESGACFGLFDFALTDCLRFFGTQTEVTEFAPTVLTPGWFAMTTMPALWVSFGVARGGSAAERTSQVSDQFLAAITWPGLSEVGAAVFVFCGGAEDQGQAM